MLTTEVRLGMEGIYPSMVVTSSPEDIPNISILSQVWYVDDNHVALSYQFFNKTKINLVSNPNALIRLTCPDFTIWDLRVCYIRTETEGTVFEQMSLNLEGIASFMGMTEIFRLKGADIYKVLEVRECVEYWEQDDGQ
jgi:hypothetical protein